MSLYHINEGTFELPDAWSDRSMNVFTPDESENPEWNIVVSRDKLDEGETLDDYLGKQIEELPKALPRFQVQSNEEITVNDYPARRVVSTWVGEKGTLRQKQIVLVKDGSSLVFTFTVLERLHQKHARVLDEFIESFNLRQE